MLMTNITERKQQARGESLVNMRALGHVMNHQPAPVAAIEGCDDPMEAPG